MRVVTNPFTGLKRWQLYGTSGQAGVQGSANCVGIGNRTYTDEKTWAQGQLLPTELGPANGADGRVCFLTRVAGKLEGGGEVVRTRIAGNRWVLDGASQQAGVNAGARCLLITSYSSEVSWTQAVLNSKLTEVSVQPNDVSGPACFLTRVHGAFEGGGEQIFVYRRDFGINEVPRVRKIQWFLSGNSRQSGVGGAARCIL